MTQMTLKRFQALVSGWLHAAFGYEIASDKVERSYRFLEEALELFQSSGRTREEALKLVDYVFGRPVGEIEQEVGGVFLTLAAFCHAHGIDLEDAATEEHKRVWRLIDKIRQTTRQESSPAEGARGGGEVSEPFNVEEAEERARVNQATIPATRHEVLCQEVLWLSQTILRLAQMWREAVEDRDAWLSSANRQMARAEASELALREEKEGRLFDVRTAEAKYDNERALRLRGEPKP